MLQTCCTPRCPLSGNGCPPLPGSPQDLSRKTGLEKLCRMHKKAEPQTNSKTILLHVCGNLENMRIPCSETTTERLYLKNCSRCTKIQPRRPTLKPFRGVVVKTRSEMGPLGHRDPHRKVRPEKLCRMHQETAAENHSKAIS